MEGVIDNQQGINGVVMDDQSASRCSCWVGEQAERVSPLPFRSLEGEGSVGCVPIHSFAIGQLAVLEIHHKGEEK